MRFLTRGASRFSAKFHVAFPAQSLQLAAPASSLVCAGAGGMVCCDWSRAGYGGVCKPGGGAARCVSDTTQALGSDPAVNLGSATHRLSDPGPLT